MIALKSTGNAYADQTLRGLVVILESAFPHRIRGYYLEGSYANHTEVATSDIDLIVLVKGSFVDGEERDRAEQIVEAYENTSPIELDIAILEEDKIRNGAPPSLKLGSVLLYGEPVPENIPLVSVAEWGRERTHAAYWLMTKVFGRPDFVALPRDYPNPEAEFFGYAERSVRLSDGTEASSTRDLIRVVGWAGTALLALHARQIVQSKKECHLLYRTYVNDEWTGLLEAIYEQCRKRWNYLIPETVGERNALRAICQQTLAFENHFLRAYKQFLLGELRQAARDEKLYALWVQEQIPFLDDEIIESIRGLTESPDEKMCLHATEALAKSASAHPHSW